MKYSLAAFDLDGTLLSNDKTVSDKNLAAMHALDEAGVILVPASGRIYKGIPALLREMPSVRYYILANGAVIYDAHNGTVLHSEEIPLKLGMRVYEFFDRLPVIYDCYKRDGGFMTRSMFDAASEYIRDDTMLRYIKSLRTPVDELKSYLLAQGEPFLKLQAYFSDMELRREMLMKLPELFPELSVVSSMPFNIELSFAKATKGNALRLLSSGLGIPISACAAFGDGINDASMLECAGLGVAMGNADSALLPFADYVTDTNERSGFAKAAELMLEGEL